VPEVKDVVGFADRFWYVLELKKNKLRAFVQKSNNRYDADMTMIRIQVFTAGISKSKDKRYLQIGIQKGEQM
jgi:hypothetical protein